MSRSFRTQTATSIAKRRIARRPNGDVQLPRIVERAPAPGDVHPVPKKSLRWMLEYVPVAYLYGLRRIELRPRKDGDTFGTPFGVYLRDERAVLLYSLPTVWLYETLEESFRKSIERHNASITHTPEGYIVRWPRRVSLALWFFGYVITHELGHHYNERYKFKRKARSTVPAEEASANLHAERVMDAFLVALCRQA